MYCAQCSKMIGAEIKISISEISSAVVLNLEKVDLFPALPFLEYFQHFLFVFEFALP